MDKKQMYVQVVNLETGKVFSLPTLYTDRTEACVCGQNYVRDRQAEDPGSMLFFRVLLVDRMWDNDMDKEPHPVGDCDEDGCSGICALCGLCYEDENEDEEDSKEPDWEQFFEEWHSNPLFFLRVSK